MRDIGTASGGAKAFAHTSKIEILGIRSNGLPSSKVLFTINDTPIDFIKRCGASLLGVDEFLAKFILTVDYPRKAFSIRNPAS